MYTGLIDKKFLIGMPEFNKAGKLFLEKFNVRNNTKKWILLSVVLSVITSSFGAACSTSCSVSCAAAPKSVIDMAPANIEPINAPFDMPKFKRPEFPDRIFNIKDYGAVEGGNVLNRKAINKAIKAASKAGGGKVVVPAGKWLTGAIELKSNVNLHLDKDAVVLFSDKLKDYLPGVFSRHEGMECIKPSGLIYAYECENIAITGKGKMHGQGKAWWGSRGSRKQILDGKTVTDGTKRLNELCNKGVPVKERIFDGTQGDFVRPSFINPIKCKNVFMEDFSVFYGPMWTINPVYCENLVVRKIFVETEGDYGHTPNGDGINPDSCKNVLIEYCDVDTGDDCFTIKSGRSKDGLRVGIPCENIVIRNCHGWRGHGGVVIGSETSGGIYNIFIRDCSFDGTSRGLRFKTARGRGASIENVWVQDIKMGTIQQQAIIVNTLRYTKRYPAHPVDSNTPTYRNLNFRNITCEYSKKPAIKIVGLPEKPMKGLSFENIKIKGKNGIQIQDAGEISFKNIEIIPDSGPVLKFDECFDIKIDGMKFPKDAEFIDLIGSKTKNIKLSNIANIKEASEKIDYGKGVSKDAVSF